MLLCHTSPLPKPTRPLFRYPSSCCCWCWCFSTSTPGNKNEEAAELLEKAANYYKLGKAWREATEAYRQLAGIQIKQDSKHDAANAYVEGAKCAMKVQPQEAVVLLQSAVELYTDMGRLNMAARQLRDIADAQEKQGLKEEALQFYAQAADLFATENATSDANKARIKVAELSAELDRYQVRQGAFCVCSQFPTDRQLGRGVRSANAWHTYHHQQQVSLHACMDDVPVQPAATAHSKRTPNVAPAVSPSPTVQAAEEIYVDVARSCTESNLLKFSAKGYLLQAGICALCYASDDDMAIKLEQYRSAGCGAWAASSSALAATTASLLGRFACVHTTPQQQGPNSFCLAYIVSCHP